MRFIDLLDVVFFIMSVASWITAAEMRKKYHKQLNEVTALIDKVEPIMAQRNLELESALQYLHGRITTINERSCEVIDAAAKFDLAIQKAHELATLLAKYKPPTAT